MTETHGEYEDRQARLAADHTPTTTPTQVEHPGRAVVRTIVAGAVGLAVLSPAITPGLVDWARENAGILPEWVVPAVVAVNAAVLAASALVTRVLAVPGVDKWLATYIPPLSASKK